MYSADAIGMFLNINQTKCFMPLKFIMYFYVCNNVHDFI